MSYISRVMHPALLVGEIQLHIFNEISNKNTLNALARTCQAFTEAALDVLWRDLDSFTRLIECMPHDLWTSTVIVNRSASQRPGREVVYEYHKRTFKLCRTINSSDWDIFQKYSRRVHYIRRPSNPGPPSRNERKDLLDDACILALCSLSAPARLLPHLKSLIWTVDSDSHLLLLPRLLSPSLISLGLFFPVLYRRSQRLEFAPQISFEICPSLRSLTVSSDRHLPQCALEGLKRSISQLQSLDVLSWYHIGSETILSLGQLSTLTRAAFELPSNFFTYTAALPSHSPMPKPVFSAVRMLQIAYGDLTSMTAFLNYFNVGTQEIMMFSKSQSPSQATTVRNFIAALGSSVSRDNFQCLNVIDKVERDRTGFHPIGIRELSPLLTFHRLQHLELALQCPIVMNDAMLFEAGA
ncbi:hypothetical protein BJ138DRAFT_1118024 [Hygrophoropsis aurantiaca]|uniref:Uncharacterized protein n=1 Tax=Hygrophoropsis aurantiaca TaxID=72124 RepID=A0ACB7ZXZ8_9AGAM|nr:hypothetical protein BJ138DRAFT_1118024 [Hygrophoropsis aurantiaca]